MRIKLILWLCLLLSAFFWGPSASALRVLVDPGHGGSDQGAQYGGVKEADLVLQLARKLVSELKKNPEFQVSMSRDSNQSVSLSERVKKAEAFGADIFVSLHANASLNQKSKGMEVYFQNQIPIDEDNYYLANVENMTMEEPIIKSQGGPSKVSDLTEVLADLHRQGRVRLSLSFAEILRESWEGRILQAPFYVLNQSRMPSVLIEVGFLSHIQELRFLAKPQTQLELARRIYKSLVKYADKVKSRRKPQTRIN